jgi:hypothetical protein
MPNNEHEENLLKEFASSTNGASADNVYENGVPKEKEPVRDLGKVKIQMPGKISQEELDADPNIRKMQSLVNYVPLVMAELPTQGRFYSPDARIHIRAARVGEVREYSMMDETNPSDVIDKMNYILSSCSKIMFGNMQGSYKDILDHDRFYVLLKISELTFVKGETNIQIPIPSGSCKTPGCKHQKFTKLSTSMLERPEPDELLEKYYDETNRCYSIRTKSYGTIQIAPPTIGVTSEVREWAIGRAQNSKEWDQSIVQMLPFFRREWRNFGEKEIFNMATEFEGWDIGKYNLVYRMIEKLNASVGMSPNIHIKCESCGGDMVVPVMFQSESDNGKELQGGFKALFVQNISDRLDELL